MKRKGRLFFILQVAALLSTVLLVSCGQEDQSGKEGTMTNEITPMIDSNGADPWVWKQDNIYYYTKTTGNNVTIFKSDHLTNLSAGEDKVIYEPTGDLGNLWAPELHYIDNCWYVYFAADQPEDIHKMYVLVNENKDPFQGQWECVPMKGMDDKFAIDGTVLDTGKERYYVWSGWMGKENVQQDIYIAQMISPVEIKKQKILLSSPKYKWEKQGNPLVNEAPQIIIKNNTINLVYSASGSWTNDYCMGLMTADLQGDLLLPESWDKKADPIFQSANGIYGPGHNSFTVSPDGSQDYMIYHSARWDGSGWNRAIRLQEIKFNEIGQLLPGEPKASNVLFPIPKGEPQRLCYGDGDFSYSENIQMTKKAGTVMKKAAAGFEDTADTLTLACDVPEDGVYTVFVYARMENSYDEKNIIGLQISINGQETRKDVFPSEYYQPVTLKGNFKKGKNEIIIFSEIGGDEISIDRIEIMNSANEQ